MPRPIVPRHYDADVADGIAAAEAAAGGLPGFLGITTVEVAPARMVCEVAVRPDLLNPFGTVHGGVVSALVDHVLGAVLYPHIERGRWAATTTFTINLLAAARTGTLRAEATIVGQSRRLATVQIEVTEGERLIAVAQGTVALPDAPSTGATT
jgi:uncharacterized protein (TIGR00369 family)